MGWRSEMDLVEVAEWLVILCASQGLYDFLRWTLANHLAHRLGIVKDENKR